MEVVQSIANFGLLGAVGGHTVAGLLTAGGPLRGLGFGGVASASGERGVESNLSAFAAGGTGGTTDVGGADYGRP